MEYMIRRVRPGDEEILAYIQTESWKAGFSCILDDKTLDRYTQLDKVTQMYSHLLASQIGNGYLLFADGAPHYIAWWDFSRDKDMPGYAELICIHSLQERWRNGYGRAMMSEILKDVAKAGYAKIMLWVYAENQMARAFYESLGFIANGKQKNELGAMEVCYEKALIE